ncbi:MAG: alpha/beta hydrolase [Acidithiobacillales bacterium]
MTRLLVFAALVPFLLTKTIRAESPRSSPRIGEIRIATATMPKPVPVRLWLPGGFDEAPRGSLPLLVFLHDGYGSQKSFSGRGLDRILEGMIAGGEVPPMVVASPRTFGTYNSNDRLGKARAFDFLVDVLVPELLERFPQLRQDPGGRGLTGISMGAYGALKVALRRPELYGSVSALSPWVEDLSFDFQKKQNFFLRLTLGRVFGTTAETSTLPSESLFAILATLGPPRPERPPLLLVAGNNEHWYVNGSVGRLERALDTAGVPFESRTAAGGHDWDFWRASLPEIVLFHAAAFGPGEESGARSKASAGCLPETTAIAGDRLEP